MPALFLQQVLLLFVSRVSTSGALLQCAFHQADDRIGKRSPIEGEETVEGIDDEASLFLFKSFFITFMIWR